MEKKIKISPSIICADLCNLEHDIKEMEQLRDLLPHAQITIYDYKQSVGLKYISEPDGQASFFQYDVQGRLKQRFRKGEKGEMQLMEYNRYHYNK